MKKIGLLFIMMIAVFQMQACDCVTSTVTEDYANHSNVFKARIVSVEEGKGYGKLFTVQVIESYKGELSKTIQIRTGHGGPDCGFGFEVGKEYLIFASSGLMYSNSNTRLLETTYCSNTGLFSERAQEMKALNALINKKQ